MKGFWFVLIVTMTFLFGCDDYAPFHEKPSIKQEKMANIVADVHIIEAHLQNSVAQERDSLKSLLYDQLFKIYEMDSTVFFENQQRYYQDTEALQALYVRVLEIIEEKSKENK